MDQGGQPGPHQGSVDKGGGRQSGRAGHQVRPEKVDPNRPTSARPHRQAVPRTMAQPPQSEHQKDGVDRGGGQHHLPGAPPVGQPVGQDRQAAARSDGQRHQEPLELDDATKVRRSGGDAT
uniref:(northern house mosquito) hypothetical protein n=1 Tax=Culex pipiens TaxID=7175 RepID=A0A8D8D621_CULPI